MPLPKGPEMISSLVIEGCTDRTRPGFRRWGAAAASALAAGAASVAGGVAVQFFWPSAPRLPKLVNRFRLHPVVFVREFTEVGLIFLHAFLGGHAQPAM